MGKNGSSDGIDTFVASVLNAGFGSGGEAAEIDVSQRIFQVGSSSILRVSFGGAEGKKAQACLSLSADFAAPAAQFRCSHAEMFTAECHPPHLSVHVSLAMG